MTTPDKPSGAAPTPLPWVVIKVKTFHCEDCHGPASEYPDGYVPQVHIDAPSPGEPDNYRRLIAVMGTYPEEANAALIVEAVNAYARLREDNARLREALRGLVDLFERGKADPMSGAASVSALRDLTRVMKAVDKAQAALSEPSS